MTRTRNLVLLAFIFLGATYSVAHTKENESGQTDTNAVGSSASVDRGISATLHYRPVPGKLTSPFGWRDVPVKKRKRRKRRRKRRREHKGLDFAGRRGTPIHVAGKGVVVRAYKSKSYGRIVIVNHGGDLQTRYAHMQRIKVKTGQRLKAGAIVGTVGSSGRATGPHLHFEVRKNGVALPPSDVVTFPLPECKKNARDCKRSQRKNNS